MNAEGIIALLREAFYALPDGSIHERTAHVMRRRAELERGIDNSPSIREALRLAEPGFTQVSDAEIDAAFQRLIKPVKPFVDVADDPAVKRAGDEIA